jgi:hypothetical protein
MDQRQQQFDTRRRHCICFESVHTALLHNVPQHLHSDSIYFVSVSQSSLSKEMLALAAKLAPKDLTILLEPGKNPWLESSSSSSVGSSKTTADKDDASVQSISRLSRRLLKRYQQQRIPTSSCNRRVQLVFGFKLMRLPLATAVRAIIADNAGRTRTSLPSC